MLLPKIGDKDKFRIAQESFQTECRAESMVCHIYIIIHFRQQVVLNMNE